VKPTSPVHRGGGVHVAVRILLPRRRTRAPAEEVTEVALIAKQVHYTRTTQAPPGVAVTAGFELTRSACSSW
jgi:hypothetical protein